MTKKKGSHTDKKNGMGQDNTNTNNEGADNDNDNEGADDDNDNDSDQVLGQHQNPTPWITCRLYKGMQWF